MTTPSSAIESDAYYKKHIPYRFQNHHFAFAIAHTLFSSFTVDNGTDLLLRTIAVSESSPPRHILDIGCGCGVLGIVLARLFPQAQVTMVDKDLLAVRYARYNCWHNETPNTHVLGSVGLEQIAPDACYDLIVSNIPAKVGEQAIEDAFLREPLGSLAPQGAYWFVVVSGLNHLIPRLGTRHDWRLKEMKKRSGHAVYRLLPAFSHESFPVTREEMV